MIPYRPWHAGFWPAYAVHMRPYLLFISGVAGFAGMAVSPMVPPIGTQVVVFAACFMGYGFGQALTDCSQIDTDRISAPYRPLSRGLLRRDDVAALSLLGLLLTAGVLAWSNSGNVVLGAASVIGLATYSFFKRRSWWGGPMWNSWIVALLPWMGALASAPERALGKLEVELAMLCAATFVSYASFVVVGHLKDVAADRASGYRTMPVVLGWRRTARLGDVLQFTAVSLFAWVVRDGGAAAWAAWVVATACALHGQWRLPRREDAREFEAATAIAATVRSLVWFHVAVAMAYRPSLWIAATILVAAFEWTLRRRPMRDQV